MRAATASDLILVGCRRRRREARTAYRLKNPPNSNFIPVMPSNRHPSLGLLAILVRVVLALAAQPAQACTIFVLTDANHALFCNSEDWSIFNTRIWFQPAGKGYYGAVYVGFDDGWPQGGLNTEGLAYDWVMFSKEPTQKLEHSLPTTRGPACRRMLETCATVKEAIAFFRTHAEPGFGTSKILVADKTG